MHVIVYKLCLILNIAKIKALHSHKKTKHHIISLTEVSGVVRLIGTENRMVIARAWGREKGELLVNGHRVSVFPDEKVLETVYTIIGIYLKLLNCTLKND